MFSLMGFEFNIICGGYRIDFRLIFVLRIGGYAGVLVEYNVKYK